MKKILMLVMVAMSGCSDDAPPAPPAASTVAAAEPKIPRHYYSLEENGQYGYERGISENDEKEGRRALALMMISYIGNKNDVYSVEMSEGASRAVFSCKSPCEFVKSRQYFAGEMIRAETIRNTEGSLIWAVMQDAQNGMLTAKKSKATTSGDDR